MKPSLASGSPLKMYQNSSLPDLDVHRGEKFRHRRIQAGHDDVIIVHLAGVRNDGNGIRLGQRGDLARLGDAADAVGVELDVVQRAGLEQVAKTVSRVFVLAAGDGDAAVAISTPRSRGCRRG